MDSNDTKSMSLLREHIPLKQGLRPPSKTDRGSRNLSAQRAYSIKTRIKTGHLVLHAHDDLRSESIFH